MLDYDQNPQRIQPANYRTARLLGTSNRGSETLEARVKPQCVQLYPGVDPAVWYQVVQQGEYKDDLEGLWIQVTDWVTYVLAKHFDVKTRPETH